MDEGIETAMEPATAHPQKKLKRPVIIGIGLFAAAVVIVCVIVGIWLLTKPGAGADDPTNSTSTTTPRTTTSAITIRPTTTSTTPPPPPRDTAVRLTLANNSIIHVWMKAKREGQSATLFTNISSNSENIEPVFRTEEAKWFEFSQLELNVSAADVVVEFSWLSEHTTVSYLYAFEPDQVKTQGIRPAFISDEAKGPPVPQSFHFRPPLGWNNDPNGFSRSNDGLYHLFYQHNPHNKKWEAMHWGHAISRDLVNWVHQPIILRPTDKICGNECGWFSGSAIPYGDEGLRIFVTDHNSTRPVREFQSSVITVDGVLPQQEEPFVVIGDRPENPRGDLNLTRDFRDPNVFLGPNGYYYMTLGSKDQLGKGGVILLYRTKERSPDSEWQYQQVLLTDNLLGTEVCECSGIVPLGDPSKASTYYALLYARMSSQDKDGRQNLSPIILASFDGSKFTKVGEQELDFAAGSYGFQAFYDPIGAQPLLIGWLANWPDYRAGYSEFPTSMTLPRVLKFHGNQILMGPHPNVEKLRDFELDGDALRRGNVLALPAGTAYVRLGVNYNYFYNGIFLAINHPDYLQLGVRVTYAGLEIVKVKENDKPNRRYIAWYARPELVHIYVDRDSVEVFGELLSDGMPKWAGSTRLTGSLRGAHVSSLQLTTGDRYNYVMSSCNVWSMKPAQLLGSLG